MTANDMPLYSLAVLHETGTLLTYRLSESQLQPLSATRNGFSESVNSDATHPVCKETNKTNVISTHWVHRQTEFKGSNMEVLAQHTGKAWNMSRSCCSCSFLGMNDRQKVCLHVKHWMYFTISLLLSYSARLLRCSYCRGENEAPSPVNGVKRQIDPSGGRKKTPAWGI